MRGVLWKGLWLATGTLGAASFLRAVYHLLRGSEYIDFTQFYLMAYVSRVDPSASFYDPGIFHRYYEILGIPHGALPNYPPLAALLFRPFTLMSYSAASTVWLALNIVLAAAVIRWAWRRVPASRPAARWFACGFILLLPATTNTLLLGQVDIVVGLLLLLVASWAIGSSRAGQIPAAVGLGLAGALKVWPLLLCGYFMWRRRYRTALGGAALAGLLTLGAGFALGIDTTREYFLRDMPGFAHRATATALPVNQSIWGVAARLFLGGAATRVRMSVENLDVIRITPLGHSSQLYGLTVTLFLACTLVAAGYLMLFGGARPGSVEEHKAFWFCVVAILTVLPFSWNHYSFFLVFPLVLMLADERDPPGYAIRTGTICLLLTLFSRFWAWLPPHALLLGFGLAAMVLMEGELMGSIVRRRGEGRHTVMPGARR